MLTALSESRVTHAVMAGVPLVLEHGRTESSDAETERLDLSGEARNEAGRAETLRLLANRSPRRLHARRNPAEIWLTRIAAPTRATGLVLLAAVDIETEAGDGVHAEHVVVRLTPPMLPIARTSAALRRHVADQIRDPQVQRLLDGYARNALSRVSQPAATTGTRVERRRDSIERAWASAAQQIVQLRMLAPMRATARHHRAPAATVGNSLTVRWRLVGALLREGRGGR